MQGTFGREVRAVTAELHTRIRGIVFDWGDTLIRPPGVTTDPEGHYACVEAFFHAELLPELHPADRDALPWTRFRPLYEQATMAQVRRTLATGREHSFAQRLAGTLELAGTRRVPGPASLDALAAALGQRITAACVPIEGAAVLLPGLRRQLRLGLLSNYPHAAAVRESLAGAGLIEHLDAIVISSEIGWSKPSRPAFEAVMADMDLHAHELLFVGDDLDTDMRGARAMGMHTAWLPRSGQSAAGAEEHIDLMLESLSDLARLAAAPGAGGSE